MKSFILSLLMFPCLVFPVEIQKTKKIQIPNGEHVEIVTTERGDYALVDTAPALDDSDFEYSSGTPFTVRVYLYDTHQEVRHQYWSMGGRVTWHGKGFSAIMVTDQKQPWNCDLHLVKPAPIVSEPELLVWGHELRHCLEGMYHTE